MNVHCVIEMVYNISLHIFTVNPASIQDLLIQAIKLLASGESHDSYEGRGGGSDEEDEGEIVSDDEEMQVDSNNPSMTIRYNIT